jgi:hypothetical protein
LAPASLPEYWYGGLFPNAGSEHLRNSVTAGRDRQSNKKGENMKLDKEKFKENEAKSNHAVVAMEYADCPIKESKFGCCFYIATGFGGAPTGLCEYVDLEVGECNYQAKL